MKNCEGCHRGQLGTEYECYYARYEEIFICPCHICIIKSVCEIVCEEFESFVTRCAKGTNLRGELI